MGQPGALSVQWLLDTFMSVQLQWLCLDALEEALAHIKLTQVHR